MIIEEKFIIDYFVGFDSEKKIALTLFYLQRKFIIK